MAAPASKTIHNLNGKWQMNKSLSGDFGAVLSLQGIGFLVRKAISAGTITLHVSQIQAPPSEPSEDPIEGSAKTENVTHINIDQTMTGGIKGTTERRCVDNRRREHSDWLFGHVVGRTLFYKGPGAAVALAKDFPDAFLAEGWPEDGEDLLVSYVKNLDKAGGWEATQVWGFQTAKDGTRRYVRNIVVTKGEGSSQQRVTVQLIYDFLGELDDAKADDGDLTY
ncbi:hypothetical protein SPBR_01978 [Sporothrix brasiliensis 5110]|uniref:Lipocalin-like domain-containing protein n=1 Tax=Sporothrix brasiliensis 5110 TaxID=1398154 RepID=A0A0C2IRW3_9PEZI|nr:uncharacterized protein SPBR_01978 [Sporothrix brasiliensis 5110]KIH91761.1 hypothetical protein SPBR_01978 [Sporothrix brasiliensis 5110]